METMISKEHIQIIESVSDWKEALTNVVDPLIRDGFVEPRYLDGIFENTEKFGPYYVIAPNIAFPHARSEQGAIHKAMSILLLKKPVKFSSDGYDVRLLVALSAPDSQSHLESLVKLSDLLGEKETVDSILQASSVEELYEFFKKI